MIVEDIPRESSWQDLKDRMGVFRAQATRSLTHCPFQRFRDRGYRRPARYHLHCRNLSVLMDFVIERTVNLEQSPLIRIDGHFKGGMIKDIVGSVSES